jgi:hypothetical protein
LRAIDKYNTEHVWLVLTEPVGGKRRFYYHDSGLDDLPLDTPLRALGVGGIAWDGSDWEYSQEVEADGNWARFDQAREDFHAALDEHEARVAEARSS